MTGTRQKKRRRHRKKWCGQTADGETNEVKKQVSFASFQAKGALGIKKE